MRRWAHRPPGWQHELAQAAGRGLARVYGWVYVTALILVAAAIVAWVGLLIIGLVSGLL